jgi:hypothetical protein
VIEVDEVDLSGDSHGFEVPHRLHDQRVRHCASSRNSGPKTASAKRQFLFSS